MTDRPNSTRKQSALVEAPSQLPLRSQQSAFRDPKAIAAEFFAELDRAVGPLQRALVSLLTRTADTSKSPTELAANWGIPKMLAWRMWRLAHACSPAEAASFVTGNAALTTFLSAAARRGATAACTNEVRLAHTAYSDFVRQAAADEATLKLMVAAMSDTEQLPDANIIRSMFDANRIRVGVQAASELVCFVLFPAELEGIASAARVHALGDCWWLRPDARATIPGGRLSYVPAVKDPKVPVVHLSMPLDPKAAEQQDPNEEAILSPLPAFSSGDSTAVICERAGESVLYSIAPLKIGLNHASTLCFGNVKHDCFLPLEADPQHIFGVDALIPVEQLVAEVYVHRDLVRKGFAFRAILNDRQFRPEMFAFGGARVELAALGGAFQVIEPTETLDNPVKAPPYHDLMNFVFDRLQHVRRDFFCFRLRLPTPPLGMRVNLIAGQDLAPCDTEKIY